MFPVPFEIWNYLITRQQEQNTTFSTWLRKRIKFQLRNIDIITVNSFRLEANEKKLLKEFRISEKVLNSLGQNELVKWMFIKSILSG